MYNTLHFQEAFPLHWPFHPELPWPRGPWPSCFHGPGPSSPSSGPREPEETCRVSAGQQWTGRWEMGALSRARPYVSRGLGSPSITWGAGAVASRGPCHGPWTLKTGALQSLQGWDQRQAGGCLSHSRASSMRTPLETKGAPPPFRLAWGSGGGPPAALGGQTTLPNPSPWGSSRLSWAVWLLLLELCFLFPSCQGQRAMGWGFREAGQGVGWGGEA